MKFWKNVILCWEVVYTVTNIQNRIKLFLSLNGKTCKKGTKTALALWSMLITFLQEVTVSYPALMPGVWRFWLTSNGLEDGRNHRKNFLCCSVKFFKNELDSGLLSRFVATSHSFRELVWCHLKLESFSVTPWRRKAVPSEILQYISLYCLISLANFRLLFDVQFYFNTTFFTNT